MRNYVYSAVVIGAICVNFAGGAARDRDVDRALKKEYPNAKTEIIDQHVTNGVKVFQVRVTTEEGDFISKVTEFGDFVVTGESRKNSNISQPAQETLNGLFKAGQSNVDCYKVTNYLVDVTTGKKTFRIILDPLGEIRDIQNEAELRKEEPKNLEKVNAKDKADKADDYAKKYMAGNTVQAVYRSPEADDFFIVEMKQKDGKEARMTLNNLGRVFSEREEVAVSDLPKPVAVALDREFDNTKIVHAYRYEYEFYAFQKTSNGGQKTIVEIRPNGDVLHVSTPGLASAIDKIDSPPPAAPKKK